MQLSLAFIAIALLTFFIARRIVRLPSRYERRPKNLSPWNALDQGIDPSLPEQMDA